MASKATAPMKGNAVRRTSARYVSTEAITRGPPMVGALKSAIVMRTTNTKKNERTATRVRRDGATFTSVVVIALSPCLSPHHQNDRPSFPRLRKGGFELLQNVY